MKRFIISDIPYYDLQTRINRFMQKGWSIYRMDNLHNDCRYKVFFTKDLLGEDLEKFDSK